LTAWLEDAYFQAVMRKYPAWKPDDKPVFLGNGLGYVCDNQGG